MTAPLLMGGRTVALLIRSSRVAGAFSERYVRQSLATVERISQAGREQIPIPYKNHYVLQLEHFRDCIAQQREPLTSGHACLRTEQTREMLYKSID